MSRAWQALALGDCPSTGCTQPILLKKSAMVSTAEKYALENEIFTLSRGFLRDAP
jgi:hypothetical protein